MTITPVNTPEYKMQELKLERNRMLADCDWTQANDSPLSDAKKKEWATYRQALRDITKTVDVDSITLIGAEINVSSVNFPTKPSQDKQ